MKKALLFYIFFLLPSVFISYLPDNVGAYSTWSTCTFYQQSVVWNSVFWTNVTCTISGTVYDMGSANYVWGSFGSSPCWTNSLNTANYWAMYFYSASCSWIQNSWQVGTGTATNVILSMNKVGLDRTGPAGPKWDTWSVWRPFVDSWSILSWTLTGWIPSPAYIRWATGSTGATGSFIYNSWAINWYFDTLQASYELPSWNLVLHLSAPADVQWAEDDIVFSDPGFYISSVTSVSDPNDPRIIFKVKTNNTWTWILCGWYDVTIPPSLLQWTFFQNANPFEITTKFELFGCDGYKTSAPPVYVLQQPETPLELPYSGWVYIPVIYEHNGQKFIDWGGLMALIWWLLVLVIFLVTIYYVVFRKLFHKSRR